DGWSLGAPIGGTRFWSSIICWAGIGGALGVGVGTGVFPFLSPGHIPVLGLVAGAICGLSLAARSGPLARVTSGPELAVSLVEGVGWAAIAVAWCLLCGLGFQAALGGILRLAPLWGGCFGWSVGCLLSIARNGAVPQMWRGRAEEIACAGAPMVVAGLGFAAALALALDLLAVTAKVTPVAGYVQGKSSALLALPGSSLTTALVAAVSCIGLVGGYELGLLTLLPAVPLPRPLGASARKAGPVAKWCAELLLEMAVSHAGLNGSGHDVESKSGPVSTMGIVTRIHWTSLLVTGITLMLGLYTVGNLLIALCAGVGIALG
ncbi:MAG TPA: hypothetical protein VHS28_03610, partial [Chloroflexota bacterium]|nr:hypothetical protein [Chloroflexota bacterium]